MLSPSAEVRKEIDRTLAAGVLCGRLDESLAALWRNAISSLEDDEIEGLMRKVSSVNLPLAASFTLRFLMERHYPFREIIIYQTDDDFKRRMGLPEA